MRIFSLLFLISMLTSAFEPLLQLCSTDIAFEICENESNDLDEKGGKESKDGKEDPKHKDLSESYSRPKSVLTLFNPALNNQSRAVHIKPDDLLSQLFVTSLEVPPDTFLG
jgi:hypothetical protein